MTNLVIGNSIVRIESYDINTREDTTDDLLETIAKYARITSVYLLTEDHTFNDECLEAVKVSSDIASYLDLKRI